MRRDPVTPALRRSVLERDGGLWYTLSRHDTVDRGAPPQGSGMGARSLRSAPASTIARAASLDEGSQNRHVLGVDRSARSTKSLPHDPRWWAFGGDADRPSVDLRMGNRRGSRRDGTRSPLPQSSLRSSRSLGASDAPREHAPRCRVGWHQRPEDALRPARTSVDHADDRRPRLSGMPT